MTSHKDRDWTLGLALPLGLVCLLGGVLQALSPYDEGIILEAANRVACGAVPYRDFYANYAPGEYYTLAGVFRVFGYSVLVERIWDSLVRLGLCFVVFAISRRLVSKRAGQISFLITLLLLATCGSYGYPVIPEMFWSLLGVLLLLRALSENRLSWVFLGGIATGVATLYRQDLGVYALLSATVAVLLSSSEDVRPVRAELLQRQVVVPLGSATGVPPVNGHGRDARGTANDTTTQRLKTLLFYGCGAAVVVAPAFLYLVSVVPLGDLRADFLEYPHIYTQTRTLPFPPILPRILFSPHRDEVTPAFDWAFFYAPLVVYVLSWGGLARSLWKSRAAVKNRGQQFGWMVLNLVGSSLAMAAVMRSDRMHSLAMTIPAIVLVPLLLANWQTQNRAAWSRALVRAALVVGALLYIASPMARYYGIIHRYVSSKGTISLPRARPLHVDEDEGEAVQYIQRNVPEGQAIFVGNAQHRQVFANDVLFYFLADRRPATRYYHFEPGVITTAAVQQEVIRDLERNKVNYVVLCSRLMFALGGIEEPRVNGAGLLDDYLQREYTKVGKFGYYTILKKN